MAMSCAGIRGEASSGRELRGCTPRVQRLRARMLSAPAEITTERARIITESYLETEADPIEVRRAKALDAILRRMHIFILDDELIVGHLGEKHRCAPVHPEVNVEWILNEEELNSFETRRQNRLLISAEAKAELRRIAEYWRGKTLFHKSWAALPESVKLMRRTGGMTLAHEKNMMGHCIPDWGKLLRVGFGGLRAEVATRIARLNLGDPDDLAKWDFLRSLLIVTDACSAFLQRYAVLAAKMAQAATDPARREELAKIAEVCGRIATQPAQSFQEALQLLWFGHLITVIEGDARSTSYGRFDQYMLSYLQGDTDSGRLTPGAGPGAAGVLLDQAERNDPAGRPGARDIPRGVPQRLEPRCGRPDTRRPGRDQRAVIHVPDRLRGRPTLPAQLRCADPHGVAGGVSRAGVRGYRPGTGVPQLFNDETVTAALVGCGLPPEEARDYTATGCVEHATPKAWIRGNGGWINLPKAVELALNDGAMPAERASRSASRRATRGCFTGYRSSRTRSSGSSPTRSSRW